MRGLANQGSDDVGQFLGHPIGDGPSAGDNEPEGVPALYTLCGLWNSGGTAIVGYSLLYLESLSPPCDLIFLTVCAN